MSDHQDQYKKILDPESASFRDGWLKAFSEKSVIGRIYDNKGNEIYPGQSPIEWLEEMEVFTPGDLDNKNLTLQELGQKLLFIAQKTGTASAFYAMLRLAADVLKGRINSIESEFIQEELDRYSPGGEFWDQTLRKPTAKRPAKDAIEKTAQSKTNAARKELYWYIAQVDFFQALMTNLETQRRCIKDYIETHHLDPTNRYQA